MRTQTHSHLRHFCRALGGLVVAALVASCSQTPRHEAPERGAAQLGGHGSERDDDAAWRRAADAALGETEGAVIVMDAQTGRIRAVANPRLAFEQAFPPGSTLKPFTALAALRSGVAARELRIQCRQHYAREGFEIACTHPPFNRPFTLPEAIAHSCNYYFARLSERLSASAFNATLKSFGFGARTGVNAAREAAGAFRLDEMEPGDAVGESERLLVTPIQLLTAYAALVNGGHLYRPRLAAENFAPQEVRSVGIAPAHRSVLIEGMRGAVRTGTAARAGFDELRRDGFDLIGKTGTSTASNGFRTQGWFVGFVAECGQPADAPAAIKLAVLVFAKRAHGSECAAAARRVLECGTRSAGCEVKNESVSDGYSTGSGSDRVLTERSPRGVTRSLPLPVLYPAAAPTVRLRLTREGRTLSLALEDYLRGVMAGEASVETEAEALKAQAVVSRTFALHNLGRHAKEGYDFCDLTHCQSFKSRAAGNRGAANRAAAETAGQTLVDGRGRVADVYFHASCGGRTASVDDVWGRAGDVAPAYLRGVSDETCAAAAHRQWQQIIPAAKMAEALRGDGRGDVGARLDRVIVTKRDASGRAALVTLEGARRLTLRGWDFALIVNRRLGWSTLRSTRFDVRREGANFIFRGSGLGHGLGLCQEGAHSLARRGASYRRILTHYFPGAEVGQSAASARGRFQISDSKLEVGQADPALPALLTSGSEYPSFRAPHSFRTTHSPPQRAAMSSEHFRVSYPARVSRREVEAALRTLEAARADLSRRLGAASLELPGGAPVTVNIHATTGDFMSATGQPPWAAAATRGRTVELQPLAALRRRNALTTTLRHEYAHAVIETLGRGRAPRWLAEGLAVHFAGEGRALSRLAPRPGLARAELERRLARPASAREMRALYAAAYREVQSLLRAEGEAGVWRRAASTN
jgi:stage II sporulation protein D